MSAPPQHYVTLNNGVKMPAIGLGCGIGLTGDREAARSWILSALKIGYQDLDTAAIYGTEGVVGKAVRESGIPREEIFVTTKLPLHQSNVSECIEESLRNTGFDYFDLWLIHLPQALAYVKDELFPRYPGPNGEPTRETLY
ncbi:hypothetical protein ACEPAG_1738 [Sanghuangporus baumii]